MKVAVIGSNGFIGKSLVQRLKQMEGLELLLFGKSPRSAHETLPYKVFNAHNKEALIRDFTGTDIVYYLASETIPSTSWEKPSMEVEKNLLPFVNFLELVPSLGIKRVAFVSSAGTVYGSTNGKVDEESLKKPFSPYGITKLAMENFLNYLWVKSGIRYDIYRVSNVYGEGQDTSKGLGVINTFIENIIRDKKITVYGDGSNTRNYIYVHDVAELMCHTLNISSAPGVYNISSGDTMSLNELIEVLKQKIEEKFEVEYFPARGSDNSYIDLDNSRILAHHKNFQFTPVDRGIQQTYNHIKHISAK